MDFTGKRAVVTGASRGIGRAVAVMLGGAGCEVVVTGRDESKLAETGELVKGAGGEAYIIRCDLCGADDVVGLADEIKGRWERLDVLVNNAGVTLSAEFERTGVEDWDKLMAVNARAPFILCRDLLGLLRESERGFVINVASVVGVKGYAKQSAYTASKHALRGMSISLANEIRDSNVRVHVICTGGVDTDMVGQVRPDIDKGELIGADEVADSIKFLLSRDGKGVFDELRIRRESSGPWF